MSLVSVIVPIYNVEKYLKVCIESLTNQTYKDLEIILVDDGSPDNSYLICEEYANKDSRIKILRKKNGGLSDARNAGLKIATGDYLFFVDSDDYIINDCIEILVEGIKNSNADIATCNYTQNESLLSFTKPKKIKSISSKKALKYILKETKLNTSASAKLIKSCLFKDIEFPVGKIYEDYATMYKVFDLAKKITITDVNKYFYRPNSESITGKKFYKKQLEYFEISNTVMCFIKDKYPDLQKYVNYRAIRMAVSFVKKISETNYGDLDDINFLISLIRKNSVNYLFSGYNIKSKMYALFISLFPKCALKFFKNKR